MIKFQLLIPFQTKIKLKLNNNLIKIYNLSTLQNNQIIINKSLLINNQIKKIQFHTSSNLLLKSNNEYLKTTVQPSTPIKLNSNTIKPYLALARVDKPIGTMLLLWPCLWSIGMASYATTIPLSTTIYTAGLFTTGAFIMRGAGCTINDLWDIKFDKKVKRTATRPLASGALTRFQAMQFLSIQLLAGLAILIQLNWYSIALGASSLALVIVYPLMKRITYWPQLTLGLAFNWGALLGWSAIAGSCNWGVVLPLYIAGINWTLVYDTIYAHQDKKDDVQIGVKSTALHFGSSTKYYLTGFSTSMISLMILSGYMNAHGISYYLATLAGASHLAWQIKTVDLDNSKDCWEKFKSNNTFGAIITAGIIADLALKTLS